MMFSAALKVCRSLARDWSKLSCDILESIANRLGIEDYIRAEAVCKSWQLVLRPRRFLRDPHNELPWLGIPEESSDICKFYNLKENRYYHIYLPELRDCLCIGSSHGWMVVVDNTLSYSLLNPLTRSRIHLPSVTSLPEVRGFHHCAEDGNTYFYMDKFPVYSGDFFKGNFFKKVILSANPSLTSHYTVMVIYGRRHRLAFCRQGDTKWTLVQPHHNKAGYLDLIYWKQQFYALDVFCELVVCDLGGAVPEARTIVPRKVCRGASSFYLVISRHDELLLVMRKLSGPWFNSCWGDEEDGNSNQLVRVVSEQGDYHASQQKTDGFRLFRLDEESLSWVLITTYEDGTLFVGNNFGLSISTNKFLDCKVNHIYFTDDFLEARCSYIRGLLKILVVGHDLGSYDLKTDRIEPLPCFPKFTWTIWPPPFWATIFPPI